MEKKQRLIWISNSVLKLIKERRDDFHQTPVEHKYDYTGFEDTSIYLWMSLHDVKDFHCVKSLDGPSEIRGFTIVEPVENIDRPPGYVIEDGVNKFRKVFTKFPFRGMRVEDIKICFYQAVEMHFE